MTVINSGTLTEPKATLSLPLPAGTVATRLTDYGTVADGVARWEVAALEPNRGKEVCVTLAVEKPGALAFNPVATGTLAAPAKSDCATKVIGVPAILLEVVDVADPIEVGKEVTYKIRVTNQGSATGTNLRLGGELAEAQEFVRASGSTPVNVVGRTLRIEPLASLAPQAVAEWELVVKAAQAADARFRAEVSSDQFEQPITEYEATQQY